MKRTAFLYWLIGIIIVVICIVGAFYFDTAVADFMANHQTPGIRNFMRNVSRFGDWPEHLALGLLLAAIAWWRGNKRWTRIFVAMLVSLAVAGLVSRALKISTARARPSVKVEELAGRSHFSSKYHSFPSGHVVSSAAFFAVLAFANRRIGLPCAAVPVLIGYSRLYLGAHYLSDVVCAAALGILCAILVWRLVCRQIENGRGTPA